MILRDSTNAATVMVHPLGNVENTGYRDVKPTATTTYIIFGTNSTGGNGMASVTVEVS